ncbi:ATP-binding protein [Aliarcobacter cryaerophilus]|uniref:AAA-ATPase-like domain-containing protein n=1 Tax=Aliarcobacter cryaerophilus TaxID=28198 RepID=A0A2S9SPW6_9BACT|nr:ATP-binding protein [Aliarcobacter cryaerophilus]PRM88637.1 hypothetical protein CJ669_03125 [Aliarcobacter cryaerophilus]
MQLKKLPIGIQTFSKIIEDNFVYVDKTDIAYNLIEKYQYVFLSRPRRFGKSLFLDTLRNIFEGNKELFSGLVILDKWNWEVKYPVIKISFAAGNLKTKKDLEEKWEEIFRNSQRYLKIDCEFEAGDRRCFSELIRKAYEKYQQKVVILVDEYDKPILDNITNPEIANEMRDGLVDFYSVIKDSDEFIQFAFITGVSKFSKTSIFSGLNNIVDISLHREFGDICGYTQNDLETVFKEHLEGANMPMVKEWYNGYNFLGSPLYNPFDILQFIGNNFVFKNYWFESGSPSFLINLIKKNQYFLPDLSNIKTNESFLDAFSVENLNIETILYQSGYLTIEKQSVNQMGELEYKLKIPNKEVQLSLNNYIIDNLIQDRNISTNRTSLFVALQDKNIEDFIKALKSIFASIPYNNYTNNHIQNYEGFYSSVVYVYLSSLGLNIIGEDVTNKGRIDLTIIMPNTIYIIEFKVDLTDNSALKQIKEKNYAQKYLNENKPIYLLGIEFSSSEKNISKFEWEKL